MSVLKKLIKMFIVRTDDLPQRTVNLHNVQFQKISILPQVGGSLRPNILKTCMKLNWNFPEGWGVLEKIPSMGEVWIFSGIT